MSKYGTIEFKGQSGKLYSFNVYTLKNEFRPYSAVYCVTRRSNESGNGKHDKIFFGSTDDISAEMENHGKSNCFHGNEANCVCTHREENSHARENILKDLVDFYHPPCNTQPT